jgi:DNA-binding NtrC family response regulator
VALTARVLLVDDNAALVDNLRETLEEEGYSVPAAGAVAEMWPKCRCRLPAQGALAIETLGGTSGALASSALDDHATARCVRGGARGPGAPRGRNHHA